MAAGDAGPDARLMSKRPTPADGELYKRELRRHQEYNARPEVKEWNRQRVKADHRATRRLKAMHPDDYKRLLAEEVADLPSISEIRSVP